MRRTAPTARACASSRRTAARPRSSARLGGQPDAMAAASPPPPPDGSGGHGETRQNGSWMMTDESLEKSARQKRTADGLQSNACASTDRNWRRPGVRRRSRRTVRAASRASVTRRPWPHPATRILRVVHPPNSHQGPASMRDSTAFTVAE